MLTLRLASPAERTPPAPIEPIQSFRDVDGRVAARAWVVGDASWLDVPRVGTFRLHPTDDEAVRAYACPNVSSLDLQDAFERNVLPLALHARGIQSLHASAVVGPRGVLAFCASSGTGKSTLALALRGRGYTPWGDDVVVVDWQGDVAMSLPVPFRSKTSPEAQRRLATPVAGNDFCPAEPQPLAALFVLERSLDECAVLAPEVTRLDPVQALPALLPHAYALDLESVAAKRTTMNHCLNLVNRVPTWSVRFQPRWDAVPDLLDAILDAAAVEESACSPV